jgi:3-oxoacyl-[acyl-carrier-protein] synthase III
LDEASRGGAFKAGECLLLAAVGSGLCASATLLEVVE